MQRIVSTSRHSGCLVAIPDTAQLDAANADAFCSELHSALSGESFFVLDLGRVEFVDSCGVGAIISCHRKLKHSGGKMAICNILPRVQVAFDIVRLKRQLSIFATLSDALAHIGA